MGNQIGMILLILLPFVVMIALESGKIINYISAFLNSIAMILVSTKVATLGCCIVLIVGLIFAILFGVGLKQFSFKLKHVITYLAIIAVCFAIIPFSPILSTQKERLDAYNVTEEQQLIKNKLGQLSENAKDEYPSTNEEGSKPNDEYPSTNEEGSKPNDEKTKDFKQLFCEYVTSAPYFFGIDPEFLTLFPIEENFNFWYDIVINNNNQQVDYRYFKSTIYEEVIKVNDNELGDRFLGIGYVSNFPYSERDFVSQNIWFGYIGTLFLIAPYILITLYGIYLALKKIKKCFVYQNAFFALNIILPLILAFVAGHLFFGIFSIVIFALIVACFSKYQTERYNEL